MKQYDVVVVGGGAAGMFAAGFAARQGASVLLLEKNRECGKKLLITGKGRCNVTHDQPDPRKFVEAFGRNGRALLTAMYAFGVQDTIDFFEAQGVALQVERGARVFPARGDAADVQQSLLRFIAQSGVEVVTGCAVRGLHIAGGRVRSVSGASGDFAVRNVIVATGGLSYPQTGCTGDGYAWAVACGHQLVEPEPALVAVRLRQDWTAEVRHFNLKNVRIRLRQNGRTLDERFGEAFFTRSGIGGPIILDMSKTIRAALGQGPVTLSLDLKPAVSHELFDKRLQREFAEQSNQAFADALRRLLPSDLIPVFIRLAGIDPRKPCHSVTRQERQGLLALFKELELQVSGCEGFSRAIITAGGVSLRDIDMRCMRSRKLPNLFFAGEMIDLDGPTGGFNLQVCWSTGYLAGISAGANLCSGPGEE